MISNTVFDRLFVDQLGCWLKPNVDPFLGNFTGMDWSLCNQLCTGQETNIFMVGKDSCFCGNETILEHLTNGSACDVPCPTHPDQMCGDGSVVWASYTGELLV